MSHFAWLYFFEADYWFYAHFLPGKTLMTVIVAFDNGLVRSQCDQRDYHAFSISRIRKNKLHETYHYQTTFSMKLNTLCVLHRVLHVIRSQTLAKNIPLKKSPIQKIFHFKNLPFKNSSLKNRYIFCKKSFISLKRDAEMYDPVSFKM